MLRTLLRFVIVAVVFCSSGLLFGAGDLSANFNVEPGGWLKVEAERGSIEVTTGSSGEVTLEIDLKGWSAEDFFNEFKVDFRKTGNTVNVVIDSKKAFSSWFNWRGWKGFVLRAEIPYEFNVDLATSGGSIQLDDLKGEVRSETSGGSLQFGSITGPVFGQTSGGSIELESCIGDVEVETSGGSIRTGDVDGKLEARTSGGSIQVGKVTGVVELETSGGGIEAGPVIGSLQARTSGGSIRAVFADQPSGDSYLGTSGGNVKVRIASNLNLQVDASASGGQVRSELEMQIREKSKSSLEGTLNGSGPRLVLRTSGGGVSIERY